MEKKFVVALKDAVTGVLHGGVGTFRLLIDEETSGAKNFSLLVNTMNAGVKSEEHKHDVEHCFYVYSTPQKLDKVIRWMIACHMKKEARYGPNHTQEPHRSF